MQRTPNNPQKSQFEMHYEENKDFNDRKEDDHKTPNKEYTIQSHPLIDRPAINVNPPSNNLHSRENSRAKEKSLGTSGFDADQFQDCVSGIDNPDSSSSRKKNDQTNYEDAIENPDNSKVIIYL